jgi:GT2 family glycosyltransferase
MALAAEADWFAFLDVDETAEADWIAQLILAAVRHGADVIQGPVEPRLPSPLPFWASPAGPQLQDGERMKFAATGNVLFRASLIRPEGLALRFDEAMALSGGEDTDFFLRAGMKGARIIYSAAPRVTEEVPLARLTFRRQMKTAFRNAANDIYIKGKQHGTAKLMLRRTPQTLLRLMRGTALVAAAPFLAPFGLVRFKRTALSGGRHIFKSLGVLAGLMSLRPNPYRKIDGY